MLPKPRAIIHALILLILFGLMLYIMQPGCFTNLSRAYIGGARGDAGIYIYIERVSALRFFTWPSEGFDLPSFYPYRRGLAYSDNFLLPALVAKFLYLFIDSEPLVYNLIILGALTLNGYVMYLLAMHVTASVGASMFAGFVFLSCPYFAFHRGHPQLQFGFWIPLTLLAVLRFYDRRTVLRASLIGASVTGAFFCAVYYAMYCYLLAGIALGALFVVKRSFCRFRDLGVLALGNICWVLLLAPAMVPYLEVRSSLGTHPMAILRRHSPPLAAFVSAPGIAQLWAPLTRHLASMEGHLFFGFLPLAMALTLVLIRLVRLCTAPDKTAEANGARWLGWCIVVSVLAGVAGGSYLCFNPGPLAAHHIAWVESGTFWTLLCALMAVLLFLGQKRDALTLNADEKLAVLLFLLVFFVFATLGVHDSGNVAHRAPELYRFLMKLPGFDALRGLARMGVVAIMLAILLASLALAHVEKMPILHRGNRFAFLCGLLVILSAAELHARPYAPAPQNLPPEIYAEVKNLPSDAAVLALPFESPTGHGREFMNWNSLYALWMKEYNNPLVNGFSGKIPFFHGTAAVHMDSFPSRKAMSVLGTLVGVRYVIINNRFYKKSAARLQREAVVKLPDEVKKIKCDRKHNCLYEVYPVIASQELPSLDLLVPWAAHERILKFKMKAAPEAQGSSWDVHFEVLSRGRAVKSGEIVTIRSKSDWQTVALAIPSVQERVTPVIVAVRVNGNAPILVKSVQLDAPTSQVITTGPVQ